MKTNTQTKQNKTKPQHKTRVLQEEDRKQNKTELDCHDINIIRSFWKPAWMCFNKSTVCQGLGDQCAHGNLTRVRLKKDDKVVLRSPSIYVYEWLISVCKDKKPWLPDSRCLQSETAQQSPGFHRFINQFLSHFLVSQAINNIVYC